MKFYRYELKTTASADDDIFSSSDRMVLIEYSLFRETPKGYWIGYGNIGMLHGKDRWVSKTSKKRFAYPTKDEALVNYIKRTEYRITILTNQLNKCQYGIRWAKNERENLN